MASKKANQTAVRHSANPVKSPTATAPTPVVAAAVAAAPVVATPVVATPAVVTAPVVAKAPAVVAAPVAVAATPVVKAPAVCEKTTALIADLGSSDADVARDAATALGSMKNPAAVEPLIEALNNVDGFYHPVVQAAAAGSLGALGDRRAVEPLLDAVNDPCAEASAEAIRALAILGDARAVDGLTVVVKNQSGYFLPIARRAAVLAMSKLGGTKATAAIREVAESDFEDAVVQATAQEVLGGKIAAAI